MTKIEEPENMMNAITEKSEAKEVTQPDESIIQTGTKTKINNMMKFLPN